MVSYGLVWFSAPMRTNISTDKIAFNLQQLDGERSVAFAASALMYRSDTDYSYHFREIRNCYNSDNCLI